MKFVDIAVGPMSLKGACDPALRNVKPVTAALPTVKNRHNPLLYRNRAKLHEK